MKVKSESEVVQSCPTLRDPMDCSLPGSSVHGIFQASVLEWLQVPFPSLQFNAPLFHPHIAVRPLYNSFKLNTYMCILYVYVYVYVHRHIGLPW